MYWERLSACAIIILIGVLIYTMKDTPSEVRTQLINEPAPAVEKVYVTNAPSVAVNPTPTAVILAEVKSIGTPLSDRSFPDTVKTPTPAPLNFINEDQFLWLASNTSWRPYLYPNDYKIFHKLWDIASCESGNDNGWIRVDRIGDSDIEDGPSLGLMQINIFYWPSLHEAFNLFDPLENLQAAWEVWNIQGWESWSCHEE